MTPVIPDLLSTFAWKGAVLLLGCWAVLRCFSRANAAARAHVIELGFLGLVLLPVGALLLPEWRVALLPIEVADAAPRISMVPPAVAPPVTEPLSPRPASATRSPTPRRTPAAPRTEIEPALVLLGLWAGGALLILGRLALGHRLRTRLLASAQPAGAPARRLTEQLRRTFGITRPVRAIESDRSVVPGTFGTVRPVIVLPAESGAWSEERLRAVLLHELAHVARCDAAWQVLARVALALHWFNPMAWSAQRRWRLERERACDDQVLARGVRASDYATHLVELAARGTSLSGATIAMTEPSMLETRVVALLERERTDTVVSGRTKMIRTLTFLALLSPLSALAPAPQDAPPAEPIPAARAANPLADSNVAPDRRRVEPSKIGLEEILELQRRGVTPEWLRLMREVIEDPSVDELVRLHDHGVTPEFVAAARLAGRHDVDEVIAFHVNGIDPEREARLAALGHEGFSVEEQVELRALGITPEYHASMIEALGQWPSVEELVTLRRHGVAPEFARELTSSYRVSVDEIANATAQGVSVEYSRSMKRLLPALELDELIELLRHGVQPELVEAALGGEGERPSRRARSASRSLER